MSGRTARLSGGGVPPSFSGVGCRRRRLRGCGWNSTRSTLEKGQKWPPARIHFMAAALVQVVDVEDVSASNPSPLARKMMRARRKFGRSRLPSDRLGTQPQFQLRLSTPRSGWAKAKGAGKTGLFFFNPPLRLVGDLPAAKISSTAAGSLHQRRTPTKPSPLRFHVDLTMASSEHGSQPAGHVSDGSGKTLETQDSIPSCHYIFIFPSERERISKQDEG